MLRLLRQLFTFFELEIENLEKYLYYGSIIRPNNDAGACFFKFTVKKRAKAPFSWYILLFLRNNGQDRLSILKGDSDG